MREALKPLPTKKAVGREKEESIGKGMVRVGAWERRSFRKQFSRGEQ